MTKKSRYFLIGGQGDVEEIEPEKPKRLKTVQDILAIFDDLTDNKIDIIVDQIIENNIDKNYEKGIKEFGKKEYVRKVLEIISSDILPPVDNLSGGVRVKYMQSIDIPYVNEFIKDSVDKISEYINDKIKNLYTDLLSDIKKRYVKASDVSNNTILNYFNYILELTSTIDNGEQTIFGQNYTKGEYINSYLRGRLEEIMQQIVYELLLDVNLKTKKISINDTISKFYDILASKNIKFKLINTGKNLKYENATIVEQESYTIDKTSANTIFGTAITQFIDEIKNYKLKTTITPRITRQKNLDTSGFIPDDDTEVGLAPEEEPFEIDVKKVLNEVRKDYSDTLSIVKTEGLDTVVIPNILVLHKAPKMLYLGDNKEDLKKAFADRTLYTNMISPIAILKGKWDDNMELSLRGETQLVNIIKLPYNELEEWKNFKYNNVMQMISIKEAYEKVDVLCPLGYIELKGYDEGNMEYKKLLWMLELAMQDTKPSTKIYCFARGVAKQDETKQQIINNNVNKPFDKFQLEFLPYDIINIFTYNGGKYYNKFKTLTPDRQFRLFKAIFEKLGDWTSEGAFKNNIKFPSVVRGTPISTYITNNSSSEQTKKIFGDALSYKLKPEVIKEYEALIGSMDDNDLNIITVQAPTPTPAPAPAPAPTKLTKEQKERKNDFQSIIKFFTLDRPQAEKELGLFDKVDEIRKKYFPRSKSIRELYKQSYNNAKNKLKNELTI